MYIISLPSVRTPANRQDQKANGGRIPQRTSGPCEATPEFHHSPPEKEIRHVRQVMEERRKRIVRTEAKLA